MSRPLAFKFTFASRPDFRELCCGFRLSCRNERCTTQVVTVSARSRFPKIVDLELPAEPLGTLWIKDAKNSSNGHSTSPAAAQADETDRSANDGGGGGSPAVPCTTTLSEGNPSGSTADRGEKDLDVDDSVGFGTRDEGGEGKGNKKDPPDFKKKKKKVLEAEASAARGGRDVTEINYCEMLNRVLPPDIRALAWAPVSEDFSARFSCSDRTYRRARCNEQLALAFFCSYLVLRFCC